MISTMSVTQLQRMATRSTSIDSDSAQRHWASISHTPIGVTRAAQDCAHEADLRGGEQRTRCMNYCNASIVYADCKLCGQEAEFTPRGPVGVFHPTVCPGAPKNPEAR